MRVFGVWMTHPKFGRQLKVARYETNLPRTKIGVIRYLSSFIKGVGPVMAKRIVDNSERIRSRFWTRSPTESATFPESASGRPRRS